MKANEILNKIYEDRKQRSDDMMYFYTEEECQEAFSMSLDEILDTVYPKEFGVVISADEMGLITYGDFEKVYEEHFGIEWKEIAQNLLSLAETLEYFGDDCEDLRDRLRKECEFTEKQLDIIGV